MQVLVIANQTAVGTHVTSKLAELRGDGPPLSVHVVVPATPRRTGGQRPFDDEGRPIYDADGVQRATRQLNQAVSLIEKTGSQVTGGIGPADPMAAAEAALDGRPVDRIVVSTLPSGTSRWIAMDLPHRLQRRFKVPVDHIVGKPAPEEVAPRKPVEGPVKILLIEDQPADVALTREALGRVGLETDLKVASNGAEAIEALRAYGPNANHLVLLDLKMPVLDGHEFLEQAGREFDLDQLNIVVLTTSTSDSDRDRAHALGASAYLIKDPDFSTFADTLGSVVTEVARDTR